MSLTTAFSTAQNSLLNTATQMAASGRNIEGAGNANYSRKNAVLVTGADGSTTVIVSRAADAALFTKMLGSTSNSAQQQALLTGLTALATTVGDTEDDRSVSAKLDAFSTALSTYANAPDDSTLAQAAITAAEDLAIALNGATTTVQKVRLDADAQMANSVTRVNNLLKQFETANNAVVSGTVKGDNISDALDHRDAIVAQLSEEMGISVVSRGNNDMVLYTDSGATLFDKSPRAVTFETSPAFDGATVGKAVYVDGVAVTGANATMALKSGAIAGLAELRDTVTVTYQNQLNEVARGLIDAFKEADPAGLNPTVAGLFTNGTGTAVPTGLSTTLAATIKVNPAVVAAAGGNPTKLRDGITYDYNTTNGASFADRLYALQGAVAAQRTYDGSTSLTNNVSLSNFASGSVSWLEGLRQFSNTQSQIQTTLLTQASSALSNATGVNTDQEYAMQLQLERSYQGSSKLIGVIQGMYDSLFSMIR